MSPDDLLVKRFAHAVQALIFEFDRAARDRGRRDRMGVMRRELRIEGDGVGEQKPHRGEVGDIGVKLAGEYRIVFEPALLSPLDLAVPVGTFDEANGNALAVLLGNAAQPSDQRDGALAIGLHSDAKTVPAIELRIDERLAEQLRRNVEPVLLFRIDGEAKALGTRRTRQRQ